jgi:2-(1,2-epoxy-1,2-dihydrophenyl)acetyl-CoA isomerase
MPELLEEREGGVAVLTMNRPEAKNAMTKEMFALMLEALPRLAADNSVGAVMLTGAGDAFSAGGDVKGFLAPEGPFGGRSLEEAGYGLRQNMEISRWLHEMPKPTIAVIPGACAGAGLGVASACDFRVAAAGAKFTTAFANVGLSGDFGGSWFLTQLLGPAKTRELYLLGNVILAEEAERIGLVNKVVPAESLQSDAMAFAQHLAKGPSVAYRYMKRNLNLAESSGLSQALDEEAVNMVRCFETEDHKEAARAFVEKRAPSFKGR